VSATLLRVLLCLCLLVDTFAPAVAATHLALARLPATTDVSAPAQAPAGDCHGAAGAPADPVPQPAPDENCLERCLDLCLQHGVAALPAPPPPPTRMQASSPPAPRHSRPGPAHAGPLLRPPIA